MMRRLLPLASITPDADTFDDAASAADAPITIFTIRLIISIRHR